MPKMSFTDFLPAGAYRLRRAAVMTVGVLFMGFAVAALVLADLGTDPFTTACLAFAARMGWLLGSAELLINAGHHGVHHFAWPADKIIPHGTQSCLREKFGMTPKAIACKIRMILERN